MARVGSQRIRLKKNWQRLE